MKTGFRIVCLFILLTFFLPSCERSQLPEIGDYAWIDSDADGLQDANETGLQGVEVKLYDAQSNLIGQTVTDEDGLYGFNDLPAGEYFLEFIPPIRTYETPDPGGSITNSTYVHVTFHLTLRDVETDDTIDSDVDLVTRRTDVFTLDVDAFDTSHDAGFIPEETISNETPEPSLTPGGDDGGGNNGGGNNGGDEKKVVENGPTDDGYVMTTAPDASYGSEETFYLWGENCYVYMRFPLTDIPVGTNIPYANLHLKIHPNSTAQGTKIWIRLVNSGYTWDQSGLTWNNSPSPDPNAPALIDAILVPYNGDGSEDVFDVTALVQYAVNQGYANFEIVIGTGNMTDEHSQEWYSSESGKGPVLEVDP